MLFNRQKWNEARKNTGLAKQIFLIEELAYGLSFKWPSATHPHKERVLEEIMASRAFQTLAAEGRRLPEDIRPPDEPHELLAWIVLLASARAEDTLQRAVKK